MRWIRISLAAKYRILFGLAVLLIISAALSVPWVLTAFLVYEQPYREAQRLVDDYFRLVMPAPKSVIASAGEVHSREFSLLAERVQPAEEPRFIRANFDITDEDSLLATEMPAFARRAVRRFIRRPAETHHWEHVRDGQVRRFEYAHAVRATRSCLSCHDEGRGATPYQEGQLTGIITVSLPFSDELILYYRAWLLGAGILASFLAILVFYVITRKFILSPIHDLRGVATRVAEGDLTVRSQLQTGDEFEQLSVSLNTMLEKLRASQDELQRANKLLDQKLGEMAETNVALYEANRVKSEFLANVSHELRTPLSSIIGFAELLREGPAGDGNEKLHRYAENILISGRILLEIINDLLDLAKIEAGKVELHLEPVDLEQACRTLIDFMRPLCDKKKQDVRFITHGGLPVMIIDRGRLRQILFNLLSNAVKFTPEGGLVELSARRVGEQRVRLAVRDTGPGISPEYQQIIFDKFRQVDQSATREHHGTGLGLAIAKELTLLLGGQIGVESVLGEGATFWVELPVAVSEPQELPRPSLV